MPEIQPDRRTAPALQPFTPAVLPAAQLETFPSGATLHSYSGGAQPVCRLSVIFDGGSAELGSEALQDLYASLFSEGCEGLSPRQVADILDFNGANIQMRCGTHHTGFTVSMLNERVPAIMELLGKLTMHPKVWPDTLEPAQLSAITRLRMSLSRVSAIASHALNRLIMGPDHSGAHIPTEPDITSISSEDILAAHTRLVSGKHCHAFLGGMITDDVHKSVAQYLSELPHTPGCTIDINPYAPLPPQTVTSHKPEAVQSAVAMAIPAIMRQHPDYIALRLTVMALGGYFGSRLMTNIREEKGLTYGISAALNGSNDGSYIAISAQFDSANTALVISEIEKEMRRMASEPPTGAELERLKLHVSTDALETIDSPISIIGYHLTEHLVGIDHGYFDRQQQIVATLTPELISTTAEKYLDPSALRISLVSEK